MLVFTLFSNIIVFFPLKTEHCSDKLEKADIGFVVDSKADNNFGKRLEIVKKIAEGYKIGKNRNHRAALISFGDEVKTKSGLTANGETFSDALYNVRQSGKSFQSFKLI